MSSPTHIAARALALELPDLPLATASATCGLCGCPIRKGETPARPYQPSPEFGAADHVHPQRSALVCAPCVAAMGGAAGLTTRYSRALFTLDAPYRLSSAEDIGWMLMHAKPPFVAVFNTRAAAHVLFQAPVTYDRDSIGIVVGGNAGVIRAPAVLAAHAALARLTECGNAVLRAHYQWAVLNLSLYDDVADVCRLIPSHERVLRASPDPQVGADLRTFDALSMLERWALSALLLARPKRGLSLGDFAAPPQLPRTTS